MGDTPQSVEAHYTQGGLVDRILTALEKQGHETRELTPEILGPVEHLHTGGLASTREQAETIGFADNMQVLDLGCGVGGPARYIADAYGCTVVGIDLTAEFIEVADELTKRCGLADRVSFRQANAVDLPFQNERFDVVFCQNLTMNIEDKDGLYREVYRVLKPRGKFTSVDHTQGPAGEPYYPLGWANTPDISYLVPPEEMRRLLEQAGFRVVEWIDRSRRVLELANRAREAAKSDGPNPPGLEVVFGADYPERQKNLQRSLKENRLVYIMMIAERT